MDIKEEAVNKISSRPINKQSNGDKTCFSCGRSWPHKDGACPAFGKICSNFQKMNHFSNVCRSKGFNSKNVVFHSNEKPRAQDKINQISYDKNDEENDKERELICA
ncbi:unnamed protein product, partial [Brachionus calyciflorus]